MATQRKHTITFPHVNYGREESNLEFFPLSLSYAPQGKTFLDTYTIGTLLEDNPSLQQKKDKMRV